MQIQSLLAYELSLINGFGTCKNNIHSFEVALVSSPILLYITLTKKSKQVSIWKICNSTIINRNHSNKK